MAHPLGNSSQYYCLHTETNYIDQPKIVCQKVSLRTIWSFGYSVCCRKSIISFYDVDIASTNAAALFCPLSTISLFLVVEWTRLSEQKVIAMNLPLTYFRLFFISTVFILCLPHTLTHAFTKKKTRINEGKNTHVNSLTFDTYAIVSCDFNLVYDVHGSAS